MKLSHRLAALAASLAVAAATAAGASAHAHVSPPVALAQEGQVFSLAVPTETENATTTKVELTVPQGFAIDSFVAAPGWKREVLQSGSGESAVVQKVTWSGGRTPTGEDAFFQFLGQPDASKTYTFGVRQTYSDGSVVDWTGSESSDAPAPTVEAVDSLGGGGGGSSTLAIVALAVGAVGVVLAAIALLTGSGRRRLA